MTLMDNYFLNPPVDNRLYLANPQTVTADAKSETILDFKAAGCFPANAMLVIEPVTLGSGETITITPQTGSDSALASSPSTCGQVLTLTTSTTEQTVIPLSVSTVTKRYFGLDFSDLGTGDSVPITAYLTVSP